MNKEIQEKAQIIYVSQLILLMIYFKRDTSKDLLHKIGFKFGIFINPFLVQLMHLYSLLKHN